MTRWFFIQLLIVPSNKCTNHQNLERQQQHMFPSVFFEKTTLWYTTFRIGTTLSSICIFFIQKSIPRIPGYPDPNLFRISNPVLPHVFPMSSLYQTLGDFTACQFGMVYMFLGVGDPRVRGGVFFENFPEKNTNTKYLYVWNIISNLWDILLVVRAVIYVYMYILGCMYIYIFSKWLCFSRYGWLHPRSLTLHMTKKCHSNTKNCSISVYRFLYSSSTCVFFTST